VERNPLRAGLVERAEDWRWSSLGEWLPPTRLPWLDPGPVSRCTTWLEVVSAPQTEAELAALRRSVARGAPYGAAGWVERAAVELGLQSSLRSPGRPRRGATVDTGEASLFAQEP